jgi:hypothetical protein
MLRKGITILGDSWGAAYEKWLNGPAKSFQKAHQRYLDKIGYKGSGKVDSKFGKINKR